MHIFYWTIIKIRVINIAITFKSFLQSSYFPKWIKECLVYIQFYFSVFSYKYNFVLQELRAVIAVGKRKIFLIYYIKWLICIDKNLNFKMHYICFTSSRKLFFFNCLTFILFVNHVIMMIFMTRVSMTLVCSKFWEFVFSHYL